MVTSFIDEARLRGNTAVSIFCLGLILTYFALGESAYIWGFQYFDIASGHKFYIICLFFNSLIHVEIYLWAVPPVMATSGISLDKCLKNPVLDNIITLISIRHDLFLWGVLLLLTILEYD